MRRSWRWRSCWTTGCTSCVVSRVLQPSSLSTRSMQVGAVWTPVIRTLHYAWFQAFHFYKAHLNVVPSIPGSSKLPLRSGLYTRTLFVFLFSPYIPHDLPIVSFLIWSPITSSFKAEISSSVPYSETPSTCVLFLMWETMFQTHTKLETELYFCLF